MSSALGGAGAAAHTAAGAARKSGEVECWQCAQAGGECCWNGASSLWWQEQRMGQSSMPAVLVGGATSLPAAAAGLSAERRLPWTSSSAGQRCSAGRSFRHAALLVSNSRKRSWRTVRDGVARSFATPPRVSTNQPVPHRTLSPVPAPQAKTTKKIVLRLACSVCKAQHMHAIKVRPGWGWGGWVGGAGGGAAAAEAGTVNRILRQVQLQQQLGEATAHHRRSNTRQPWQQGCEPAAVAAAGAPAAAAAAAAAGREDELHAVCSAAGQCSLFKDSDMSTAELQQECRNESVALLLNRTALLTCRPSLSPCCSAASTLRSVATRRSRASILSEKGGRVKGGFEREGGGGGLYFE